MKIFVWIVVSLIIGYMWTWFIDHAFSHRELKFRLSVRMFVHALILVTLLFVYQFVLSHFGWSSEYFLNNLTPFTIGLFVLYCVVLVLFLSLWYHIVARTRMRNFIVVWSLLFLWVALWWYFLWVNIIVMYYIISAYAEEYLKFGTSNTIFLGEMWGKEFNQTDLILFSILMWLWFAGIENLFFVWQNILHSLQWWGWVSVGVLSTGRGLVATLLHVVSTGMIAYAILYFQRIEVLQKRHISSFMVIIFAILLGVSFHALYNLSLHFGWKILLFILVVVAYFILSFLLFKSDSMYGSQ